MVTLHHGNRRCGSRQAPRLSGAHWRLRFSPLSAHLQVGGPGIGPGSDALGKLRAGERVSNVRVDSEADPQPGRQPDLDGDCRGRGFFCRSGLDLDADGTTYGVEVAAETNTVQVVLRSLARTYAADLSADEARHLAATLEVAADVSEAPATGAAE